MVGVEDFTAEDAEDAEDAEEAEEETFAFDASVLLRTRLRGFLTGILGTGTGRGEGTGTAAPSGTAASSGTDSSIGSSAKTCSSELLSILIITTTINYYYHAVSFTKNITYP
jgi:hypothetical protein